MTLILDVNCPKCNKKFKLNTERAGKGEITTCPHCKATMSFKDNGFKDLGKSYDKMMNSFKKLGGK